MSVAKEFTTDRNTDVKIFDILMYILYQKFRMISIINYEL